MMTRRRFIGRAALVGGGALVSLLTACQSTPSAPTQSAAPAKPTMAPTAAPSGAAKPTPAAPAATSAPAAKPAPTGAASSAAPRTGGTLRVGYDQEHKTLDPHFSLQFSERYVMYAVFNTLVGSDEQFNPQPELAESWTNPDPKTFVFKLRQGVKFHDGTDFNAEAVKWNIERVKNPDTKSPQAPQLAQIASVEIVAPYTVKFNLGEPYAPLLAILMDRPGFIVSPTAAQRFGENFGRNPVGTGPFKFAQWTQDQGVTVERNPSYWTSGQPYLDKVEFRVIPDATVRVTMLKNRELDVIDRFETNAIPLIQSDNELKLLEFGGGVWYAMQWQVDHPPFDNKLLRQAIAWGINREALGKVHWGGYGKVPEVRSRSRPAAARVSRRSASTRPRRRAFLLRPGSLTASRRR